MKTVKEQIVNGLTWFKAKIDSIFVKNANVVNNCASTSTSYPLSAAQGKSLQDQITSLNSNLEKKTITDTPADNSSVAFSAKGALNLQNAINGKALLVHDHSNYVPNWFVNNRVTQQTIRIDLSPFVTTTTWGFILLAHSWVNTRTGGAAFAVSGIQAGSTSIDVSTIYKSAMGASLTLGDAYHLDLTFYNSDGGGYAIIPFIHS